MLRYLILELNSPNAFLLGQQHRNRLVLNSLSYLSASSFSSAETPQQKNSSFDKPRINLRNVKNELRANKYIHEPTTELPRKKTPITKALKDKFEQEEAQKMMLEKGAQDDRELALSIIRCANMQDTFKLYKEKSMRLRPMHLSLFFCKLLKQRRIQRKLERQLGLSQPSQASQSQSKSLWENEIFLEINQRVFENIESMNADSLVRILQNISIKRTPNDYTLALTKRIIDWIGLEQNYMLFDNLQTVKLIITLSRLFSIEAYTNQVPEVSSMFRNLVKRIQGIIPKQPTKSILGIFKAVGKAESHNQALVTALHQQVSHRIKYISPGNLLMILYSLERMKFSEKHEFLSFYLGRFLQGGNVEKLRLHEQIYLLAFLVNTTNLVYSGKTYTEEDRNLLKDVLYRHIGGNLNNVFKNLESDVNFKPSAMLENNLKSLFLILMKDQRYDKNFLNILKAAHERGIVRSWRRELTLGLYLLRGFSNKMIAEKDQTEILQVMIQKLQLDIAENIVKISRTDSLQLAEFVQRFYELFHSDKEYFKANLRSWDKLMRRAIMGIVRFMPVFEDTEVITAINFIENLEQKLKNDGELSLNHSPQAIYVRSVRKATFRGNASGILDQKVNIVDSNAVAHNLFVLLAIFGRQTYPIVEDSVIFTEFEEVFKAKFDRESLSKRSLDLLNEIRIFLKYSNMKALYQGIMNLEEVRTAIVRRLQEVRNYNESRRKKTREQVITILRNLAEEKGLTITDTKENQIDEDGLLQDLLVEYDITNNSSEPSKKSLSIFMQNLPDQNEKNLTVDSSSNDLICNILRRPALNYIGKRYMNLNLSTWTNTEEANKKKIIEEVL